MNFYWLALISWLFDAFQKSMNQQSPYFWNYNMSRYLIYGVQKPKIRLRDDVHLIPMDMMRMNHWKGHFAKQTSVVRFRIYSSRCISHPSGWLPTQAYTKSLDSAKVTTLQPVVSISVDVPIILVSFESHFEALLNGT